MQTKFPAALAFLAVWMAAPWPASAQSNGVLREVYLNIGGVNVADLTSAPAFPDSPSSEDILTNGFEAPVDVLDNYGQRLRALLTPPLTGNYIFYVASDDGGDLWLSSDETPAAKTRIAYVASWTSSRQWTKEANQKSAAVALTAGRSYYLEALMKEQGGGDNLAVTWQKPGDAAITDGAAPISNQYLRPYGLGPPVINVQPTNVTEIEGGWAPFAVQLARKIGATFQWIRDGTNIPGAVNANYTLAPVRLSDNNSTFRCAITNSLGSTSTVTVTLRVLPDTTPPTLVDVANLGNNQLVTVLFSEPMEVASAAQATNYTLDNGAEVLAAAPLDDGLSVALTTTPLAPDVVYTLTVNNVRDQAQSPNSIAPNTRRTFTLNFIPLPIAWLTGTNEPPGPCSRRSGLTISEIMYHPPARPDGRNLEFVELYNSNPWAEELTGHRLSGATDFDFPPGTRINAQSYLVVAAAPGDVQAVYGVPGVLGPLLRPGSPLNTNNVLDNGGGTVRLRDELDSVLLEAVYDDAPPYPVTADGAGHSLVLARPTYGASDARAWAASGRVGGSPGTNDSPVAHPYRTVLINEVLAHTYPPQEDFLELFNYSTNAVNLSGCWLSDDPATNKFQIPTNTVIAPMGWLAFPGPQLGFRLRAAGETIYFRNPVADRVIDALRYEDQENGVAFGRCPDGAPAFHRLVAPTPGAPNARQWISEVVINEIMANPMGGDDDEYVELFNRGTNAVALDHWRLRGGISFNFPAGTVLGPNGYLVVARNVTNLLAIHPTLNPTNTLGDYTGRLANRGDTVSLNRPDTAYNTNQYGQTVTSQLHVDVDAVRYFGGGRWGTWFAGGGSSLELVDARASRDLAPSWADSDETGKSGWVNVEATGLLDNGAMANADQLHLFLQGAGECLVDNVEVLLGGNNLVANGTFESGLAGWIFQGTHNNSYWESNAGYASSRSLHLVANGRGDTGANRIRTGLLQTLSSGSTVTLRAKVKWLKGQPEILLRLRGNYFEATTNILATRNLGSPGAANTRGRANTGPAITDVAHNPILPAAGQEVTVSARVQDPDGLAMLLLRYRVDPATNVINVVMRYRGAGLYSGSLPGQASGKRVAFFVQATDNHAPRATSTFPNDAPARECVVGFGESLPAGSFGTYRLWCTQRTVTRWATREKNSDEPLDSTFVYGYGRAVYNTEARYKGSPWHTPGYNSPDGNACDYKLTFPPDDPMLGTDDMTLATIGNLGSDSQYQAEQASFWIIRKLGNPYMYRRFVRLFFNGQQRQVLYEDSGQPNGDTVDQFFPDDNDGNLHKVEDWFEFDDSGDNKLGNVDATLQVFSTTGNAKKTARYRYTFRPRSYESANEWTNFFALVDAMNATQPEPYQTQVAALVDVDNIMRELAAQRIVGNWDSWGYARGKNTYLYKPRRGKWMILPWDIDFVFNVGGNATTDPLFGSNEPVLDRFRNWPAFQRAYWRAFEDAVNGPLLPAVMDPMLDGKYAALVANNTGASSPQGIKDYVAARRTFILSQLATVAANFSVSGTTNFATARNLITLSGTAPITVAAIAINGVDYYVSWSIVTGWSLLVALEPGTNVLRVQGLNNKGQPVAGAAATLTVAYTGAIELPQDKLMINEIMFNPPVADAEFIELYNRSVSNSFDLSHWRLEGVDGTIPAGTMIGPGAYLVFAKNRNAFAAAYGGTIPVAGEFNGVLRNQGEPLRLIKPGATPALDQIIDEVYYENLAPWPAGASSGGYSLQLMDPVQDNRRVANWYGGVPEGEWRLMLTNGMVTGTNFLIFLDGPGDVYLDDLALVPSGGPLAGVNVLTNGGFESPLNVGWWLLGTNMTNSAITTNYARSGQASLHVVSTSAGAANKAIAQYLPTNALGVSNQLSYWYKFGASGNKLTVRTYTGSGLQSSVSLAPPTNFASRATPGTNNTGRATLSPLPPLWLNELQPDNLTGLSDRFGHRHPWLELYNAGTNALPLAGFGLGANYGGTPQWLFPADAVIQAGEFRLVWLDGQPQESSETEWHAAFTVPTIAGSLALYQTNAVLGNFTLLDYLNYAVPSANRSFGNYPDGNPTGRQLFSVVTPSGANNPSAAPLTVFINEWMADNTVTLADPADGAFQDWLELYNPGTNAVDLSGYYLTDDLFLTNQWPIPFGTLIPPGGYLVVWADGETGQNAPGGDLHAPFQLDVGSEAIGLFGADGLLVDAVTFGPQTANVSQGRFPDGAANLVAMPLPTPRTTNLVAQANLAPVLMAMADRTVAQGSLLTFTASAADANLPPQVLTFSLDLGAPPGASIDPLTGIFAWLVPADQAPGNYPITVRVTDNGTPPMSASNTFLVQVSSVNHAPVLAVIGDRNINEGLLFRLTNSATDADLPAQTLTFSLDAGAPAGLSLDPVTGVLTWTPTEAQGPELYVVNVRVTDDGTPPLSDVKGFTITVNELNRPPVLSPLPDRTNYAGLPVGFTAAATDPDLPANTLRFSLDSGAPAGAVIDPLTGVFSWTPTAAGTYPITVRVTDNGNPSLDASQSLTITVAPLFAIESIVVPSRNTAILTWPSLPGQTYQLQSKPALIGPLWTNAGEAVTATGIRLAVTNSAPGQRQQYFRVAPVNQ